MKSFTFLITTILLISTYGCYQDTTQPENTIESVKITPRQKDVVKKSIPIEKALSCLSLLREQDSIIQLILKESKTCELQCKWNFQDSIKLLHEAYNSKLEKYKYLEKTEEIKKEIQIITFEFRQSRKDLEREYNENMSICKKNTITDIEALLRKDQLTLWNIWKATGKIPCDRVKP